MPNEAPLHLANKPFDHSCKHCDWWFELNALPRSNLGECHHGCPSPFPRCGGPKLQALPQTMWPVTGPDDFCSNFQHFR